jgi:hypothetical protein
VEPTAETAAATLMPSPSARQSSEVLLGLQRGVGNAAVVKMLADRQGHETDQHRVQRSTVHDVLRSPGRPLDEPTRTEMEARLGADLSDVRVHNDTAARDSAAEIGARAYTQGHHVVIGEGGADRHTLAHELTHVLQQRSGPVAGTEIEPGLAVSSPGDRFERAAEANADRVMARHVPRTAEAEAWRHSVPSAHDHGIVQRVNDTATPTATPALTATAQPAEDLEGLCGNFSRVREWAIANPQRGVIVQEVTRTFNVQQYTADQGWVPINGQALDTYVANSGGTANATVLKYWELWTVDEQGNVSDGGADTFGMTSLIQTPQQIHDTTKGSFMISGTAYFFATDQDPTTLGFQRDAVVTAGGLFSTAVQPQLNSLTPASGPITYTVHSTWDSTDKRNASQKAKPRPPGKPYTPNAAWSKVQAT